MKTRTLQTLALTLVALSPTLQAQDIIYYKFESGGGASVVNYATASPGIPRPGRIVTSLPVSQAWGPGRFGNGGLQSGPSPTGAGLQVDTGWDNVVDLGTDVTIAFCFRAVHPLPTNGAYFFGPSSFNFPGISMHISGSPSSFGRTELSWVGPGGNGSTASLQEDLLTPAYSDWVHLAIVIERSSSTSCPSAVIRWYVDGQPRLPQLSTGCFHQIPGTSLAPFYFGRGESPQFEYDEFRLSLRAASPAEIQQWATTDLAADASFGASCHPLGAVALLDGTSGGLPTLGNAGYTLTVYGLPTSSVLLGIGLSNQTFFGQALPLDLGVYFPSLQGCLLRTSADLLAIPMQIGPAGHASVTIPLPANPVLEGTVLYSQAFMASSILGTEMLTNAWASSLGN